MQETEIAQIKPPIVKLISIWQATIIFVLILIVMAFNKDMSLALMYGSAIFLIPNAYFAWQFFRYSGAVKTKLIARSIYEGQVVKFLLTIFMFAALFKVVKPVDIWLVFISYGLNVVIHFLAVSVVLKKTKLNYR